MKKITFTLLTLLLMLTLCGCSHTHNYKENVIAPTCTEQGYTEFTCECGDTKKENYVEALGHKYGEWVVVQQPTGDEDGIEERTCSVCNNKEQREIEHTHSYKEEIVKPTCTVDGYTNHVCECGDSYKTDIVPAAHVENVIKGTPATCTESGTTDKIVCTVCSKVLQKQKEIEPIGHSYGDWVVTQEPVDDIPGVKEKVCKNCGDKITAVVADSYTINYDLNGGSFVGGYTSFDEIADDFMKDFNSAAGQEIDRANFCTNTVTPIKVAFADYDFITKWNWLFVYMKKHLKEFNGTEASTNVTDSYPVPDEMFDKLIAGDTTIMGSSISSPSGETYSANFRTLVRAYLHGMLNKCQGGQNATFATMAPDFFRLDNQQALVANQYALTVKLATGSDLPQPIKIGYTFKGWLDEFGDIVTTVINGGTLVAQWEEDTPVESVEITNKIDELIMFTEHQLEWKISPDDAGDTRVKFESSDETIATVDENGKITALKTGTVTIKIISLSGSAASDEITILVVTPGYFDISYETVSYVIKGESIKLNATFINSKNESIAVKWSSLDETAATVDENGNVIGLKVGKAIIRATATSDEAKTIDFVVTVIDADINEALNLILNAHESNVFLRYDLPIGAGTPNYYKDILGSVSDLLFNYNFEIDTTYNKATNDKYGADLENRVMESIEFITVHYTAGFNETANAKAHGEYFSQPLSQNATSIHYSTGNDGIYKGLDEKYGAAHAGDGATGTYKYEWQKTAAKYDENDPKFAVTTITAKGTFAINGKDTGISVPEETKFGRGIVTDSYWLNDQGIAIKVGEDGYYYIGTTWWCYSNIAEGRICSKGGNGNSIGIESAVNKGSDLWYTWQITARLVADIMLRYDLDITRVKGHHFFAAKDCPQPLLENDMEIWWKFIEMVEAEYEKLSKLSKYEFEFTSNSELVNDKGRVVEQALQSEVVTYTVTIKNGDNVQTIELASIIEGLYNR